jgi:alpha-L-fucosidase
VHLFNPRQLDADQWLRAVKAAGATYAVLTAKHTTGFILFPDPEYEYAIDKTPFQGGQGDIVKAFIQSCHKHGIKPGIYYSCESNSYLNIHRSSGHMPAYPSPEWDQFKQLVTRHLTHLWSQYGELCEIWFDGGLLEHGPDYLGLLQKYQPNAVAFQGPEGHPHRIRWVGNERGQAPYPCWSTIESTEAYDGTQEIGDKNKGTPDGSRWIPAEADVPLRYLQWLWLPGQDWSAASPGYIMKWYYGSVGRNCNMLLGLVIDDRGLIPDADVETVSQFGKHLQIRFEHPVASTSGEGTIVELKATRPMQFNTVELMEDIIEGHRIREFSLEISDDGKKWASFFLGSSIGHKFLSWVPPQTAKLVRIKVTKGIVKPKLLKFALYWSTPLEDELEP